jgi:hypothetical protein
VPLTCEQPDEATVTEQGKGYVMSDTDPRVDEDGETVREWRVDDKMGRDEGAGGGDGAERGLEDSSSRDGGGATPRPAVGLRAEPFCRVIHPARNYGVFNCNFASEIRSCLRRCGAGLGFRFRVLGLVWGLPEVGGSGASQ